MDTSSGKVRPGFARGSRFKASVLVLFWSSAFCVSKLAKFTHEPRPRPNPCYRRAGDVLADLCRPDVPCRFLPECIPCAPP
eukprot:8380031-Lingulodinium_polyedra.AAC.2